MEGPEGIDLILVHAEGEIGRVVTGGLPEIPGKTMLGKLNYINQVDDSLRRCLVNEPRGSATMSTNVLIEPTDSAADAAYLILQPDGAHAMSGSNSICVVTALLETGLVAMQEPETKVALETPAGLVQAVAKCHGGKCQLVTLRMPPAFVHELEVRVEIPDFGELSLDIAFGGCFYGLINPAQVGLAIAPENARKLIGLGISVLEEVNGSQEIRHPELEGIVGLSYVMFAGSNEKGELKQATIMHPGRIDRSPCGTGSAARLAVMHARGEIAKGQEMVARSIIDSEFRISITDTMQVASRDAVIVQVSGRGWIYGTSTLRVDPTDPWQLGYVVFDN